MAAEHDLLASILSPEPAYPWQPLAPEAEPYLRHLEAELEAELDGLEDEPLTTTIAAGWQRFSTLLASQMAAPVFMEGSAAAVLGQLQQFQSRLPGPLLENLAATATRLAQSGQPLVAQLVDCVNAVLPAWNADDLAVLARPLAYSLRDGRGEILELNLRAIPATDWQALSDVEQARLTLAVASVALKAAQDSASGDPR
jgi:hypothetical protein